MKKHLKFLIVLIFILTSCTYSKVSDRDEVTYDELLENFSFKFNENKEEMKKDINSKIYSSGTYIIKFNTLDFNSVKDVVIQIKSTGDIKEQRIPTFTKGVFKDEYIKEIKVEENKNYDIEVDYYGLHREEKNDWNGEVEIFLKYKSNGDAVSEKIFESDMYEPCLPLEFETFYETTKKVRNFNVYAVDFIENENIGNLKPMSKVEDPENIVKTYYVVTKVIHSYKSTIDGEYYDGYVTYVVEGLVEVQMVPEIYDLPFGFKIFYPNAQKYGADSENLAIDAWRKGHVICEVAVESDEKGSEDYKIRIVNTVDDKDFFSNRVDNDMLMINLYTERKSIESTFSKPKHELYVIDGNLELRLDKNNFEDIERVIEEPIYDFNYLEPTTSSSVRLVPNDEIVTITEIATDTVYLKRLFEK